MIIEGNPKIQEFLSWVQEVHGQELAEQCRIIIQSEQNEFVWPMLTLHNARLAIQKADYDTAVKMGSMPFDSDN